MADDLLQHFLLRVCLRPLCGSWETTPRNWITSLVGVCLVLEWLVVSLCYGGHSVEETPGSIPNPEAKLDCADGTALGRVWESRSPPDIFTGSGGVLEPLRGVRLLHSLFSCPKTLGPGPRPQPGLGLAAGVRVERCAVGVLAARTLRRWCSGLPERPLCNGHDFETGTTPTARRSPPRARGNRPLRNGHRSRILGRSSVA